MSENTFFQWLHLSDLHVGMGEQETLWPSVKHALLADFRSLIRKVGNPDAIIFSGDLTKRGSSSEFQQLGLILDEIRGLLKEFDCSPPIIPVPGNHDLSRSPPSEPEEIALKRWWEEHDAREGFWKAQSSLSNFTNESFSQYSEWLNGLLATQSGEVELGRLAGDLSFRLNVRGTDIGVVALNSSWLQRQAGDYEGKLHVDVRQLMAVTQNDPQKWADDHAIRLLVTHHPISWLHPESLHQWDSEIYPPGRFDAHLFGHMHSPDSYVIAQAGSAERTSLQSASAFGLKYFGDAKKHERIHGYSIGRIEITGGERILTIWPRIFNRHSSGKVRFIPDQAFELNEDNNFFHRYGSGSPQAPSDHDKSLVKLSPVPNDRNEELGAIEVRLPHRTAHTNVRLPEQNALVASLQENRKARLQADWGLSSDAFICSALTKMGILNDHIYRFDFENFTSKTSFYEKLREKTGHSFERLCEIISRQSSSCIIFDNVSGGTDSKLTPEQAIQEAERIASAVLDYCPQTVVILRSRVLPLLDTAAIRLRPFDEPDILTYLAASGTSITRNPVDLVGKLKRLTDGVPSRLDEALHNLRVVGISDLVSSNSDYLLPIEKIHEVPPALSSSVAELKNSEESGSSRAFELLKVLSVFPLGEQFETIRRFNSTYQFFPENATVLLERGLLDSSSLSDVAPKASDSDIRIISLPKIVRDFIRSELTPDEMTRQDTRAFELYFGSNWKSGVLSGPIGSKFSDPFQLSLRISNASALLIRLFAGIEGSTDEDQKRWANRALSAYLSALVQGNHYRSVISLLEDLDPYLSNSAEPAELTWISYSRGKCHRMLGDYDKARSYLESLDVSLLHKDARRSALLNLALTYDSLDDAAAIQTAEQVIKLGKIEPSALQARAIIIRATETGRERYKQLLDVEDEAKRRKYHTVANTIALYRAEAAGLDSQEVDSILADVLRSAKDNKDFYNGVRAVLKVCRIKLELGDSLTDFERTKLIDAYHFIFNERMPSMFDSCNEVLWSEFERNGDLENLLRLFRHSSFIWRLNDQMNLENSFVKRLAKFSPKIGLTGAQVERERGYYLARASAALLEGKRTAIPRGRRINSAKSK